MKKQPIVSVIIPVYNAGKYLIETMESILNQTLKDIEIICVDDGSTDNSLDILRKIQKIDNRVIILEQNNLYAGIARNNGLKIAKGKYLSFLDADDIFHKTMLEDMVNQAEKDDSDIVVCEFFIYNNKTKKVERRRKIELKYLLASPFNPKEFKNSIFKFSSLNAWTKLFKKKLFTDNKIKFSDCICCNDMTAVCTALVCANKISVMNKPYIKYRLEQKNNLTARRHKLVNGFLNASKDLYKNLKRLNLYDTYKKAFIARVQLSYNWDLSECSEEIKKERKAYAKSILPKELYKIFYGDD